MERIEPQFRQYTNTGEWFADIDGKRITRKSLFTAEVYSDPYDTFHPLVEYKSRIEHCGSCVSETLDGDKPLDGCCCIHANFRNKHDENEYIKSIGFWKILFNAKEEE